MKAFDNYTNEAKRRWGNTDAYKEYEQKTSDYTEDKLNGVSAGMNAIFTEFANVYRNGETPESEAAQSLTEKLQRYITENFYTCTPEILRSLGQMYVADDRFKANIDKNGNGTAEFVSESIEIYCK